MEKWSGTRNTLDQVLTQERALARQRRQAQGQPWAWFQQTSNTACGQRAQLRRLVSGLLLLVALSFWLVRPDTALAATFTVTKPADTNDGACNADCSLREAIVAANAAPGADVITLPAGTYTLSRSGVDNTAANGDLDVTDTLTINGAAQATTIIEAGTSSATAIDRLFSFNPVGSAAGFAVALNNLTLRHGRNTNAFASQENDGGCFDFDAGTAGTGSLSLTNVTVTNCEATDGGGGGLVIYFPKGGTATLNNVTVQNNVATRPPASGGLGNGGGILVGGAGGPATLTINNSLIDNNRALKTATTINSIGGGIAIGARSNSTIATNYQIHGTRITNNQAAGDGGGIHSFSPLTIDNVGGVALFSNNQAGNNGGGLFLRHPSQTTNISKVIFSGNRAVNLGGGLRSSNGDSQTLNISFSRFVGNTAASGKGSGLSTYTAATTAANNWWGCSTGPTASPCDTAQIDVDNTNPAGTLTTAPWLRLNLTAATNPLVTGQSTGLTASFLTNSNNGAVALSNLDVLLGLPVTWSSVGGTLSGQQTTIQTNGTATANYQATAVAAGNQAVAKVDNDSTTTGANVLNITVKANTTIAITAHTPDPSTVGQAVTVNFTVAASAGTPTGNVTVSDGVNSCTAAVAAGSCTLSLATAGARPLTAAYAGDVNYIGSTSAAVAHTVNKANTTIAITAHTPDPSVAGQAVTVNFTVVASAGMPTGNVTVSDGVASCTAAVAAGNCTLSLVTVSARTLVATYSGDSNFNGSVSAGVAHTVTEPPTPTPAPPTPTPSPTPTNVRTVAAWGYNGTGASSVPTGMQAIAVAGGIYHSLALKVDGTVAAWGCTGTTFGHCNIPAGLSGVKAIGVGTGHSLAVKADGTVVAWGCAGFGYGQCTPPVGLTGVISVAGGYVHSLALKSDGTVVAWGCAAGSWSAYGQCNVPKGLSGVKAIAAGYQHNLALKNDGTVVAWGRNTAGQINVPAGLNDVVAIAAGETHSLALKSNGTVVAWGSTTYGATTIPAGLTDVVAIGAGYYHSLALKRDGTVAAWGCVGGTNYNFGQCTIPTGLSGVTSISAGGAHNLVLTRIAPSGGGAGGAVVAADSGATPLTDTIPLTLPMLGEAFLPITPSLPVSAPVAVEVAPVVTTSVPASTPVVVDTPPVTTTQPVTTGDAGAAPVDANAPAAPDASQQNQRIFLPIITNLASLAGAALGGTGGLAVLVVVVLLVVGGLVRRRRAGR